MELSFSGKVYRISHLPQVCILGSDSVLGKVGRTGFSRECLLEPESGQGNKLGLTSEI